MAALTKATQRRFETGHDEYLNELPVLAAAKLYEGSLAGLSGVGVRALVAGDPFVGFCWEDADNSAGATGDIRAKLKGKAVLTVNVTGVTAGSDVGATVYASSDNDFTLTSTSNSAVGKILRVVSGTTCQVLCEATYARSI